MDYSTEQLSTFDRVIFLPDFWFRSCQIWRDEPQYPAWSKLDLKLNVTKPMDHCDDADNMRYNLQRNDRELTSNAEVRASSGSEDVVGAATKRNSPHGLVFDLV